MAAAVATAELEASVDVATTASSASVVVSTESVCEGQEQEHYQVAQKAAREATEEDLECEEQAWVARVEPAQVPECT